jgi:sugar/nucleoside kinase (ribokinase family)
MSIDVVCAGAPFLDITFSGMSAMPALGEERMAERVQFTPGGLANVALGLTRLDLEAVVMSPVGDDLCGRILSGLLAEQGIGWVGPRADATAVSAILPLDGDRAFVTVAPDLPRDGAAIAALGPRAVVIDLPEVAEVPPDCAAYAVVGDFDARALAGRLPAALAMARALVANHSEASFLTGIDDPGQAAEALARHCPTVVVTLADKGAICAGSHGLLRQSAPSVTAVDANGAGDLFTAAWVWADLAGMPVEERLRLAVTYAAMSVRVPTTLGGALTIDEFRDIAGPFDASIPPNGAR